VRTEGTYVIYGSESSATPFDEVPSLPLVREVGVDREREKFFAILATYSLGTKRHTGDVRGGRLHERSLLLQKRACEQRCRRRGLA